jgi:hypothetical protein
VTRRVLAAAVLAVAAAGATPAGAAIHPVCQTRLADAATGTAAGCPTSEPPAMANCCVGTLRTMTVEVAAGAVDATLACRYATPVTRRVSGPAPVQLGVWSGADCTATLVAVVDHTTAAATSTFHYVYFGDPV